MEPKEWMQNKKLVLKNSKIHLLRNQSSMEEHAICKTLTPNEEFNYLVSKLNYFRRKNAHSCLEFNVIVRCGDICYIDFGHSYMYEIGYLHFGLILTLNRGKAFVVPLTGANSKTIRTFNESDHIYVLGKIDGMSKVSACYINDAKWISTSRIIDVKAHLAPYSKQFMEIKEKIRKSID